MADNIKDKTEQAGRAAADTMKKAGRATKQGAEKAADWTKDKSGELGEKARDVTKATGNAIKKAGEIIKDKA
jgi:hypothetical protein